MCCCRGCPLLCELVERCLSRKWSTPNLTLFLSPLLTTRVTKRKRFYLFCICLCIHHFERRRGEGRRKGGVANENGAKYPSVAHEVNECEMLSWPEMEVERNLLVPRTYWQSCLGIPRYNSNVGLYIGGWKIFFFLLLLNCSVWPCLGPA